MSNEVERLKKEIERLQKELSDQPGHAAERTFENLFNTSSELIYIHDEKGIFIDVNEAVIEKYGYTKEELVGQTPVIFSAPDMNDMRVVIEKIEDVWNTGKPQALEWWSITKDGTLFLKELILRKGIYFGRDVMIATGRDITERKETEVALVRKNEELRKLNEALDAFVYSASHDLKAPLASIMGLIQVMRLDKEGDTDHYIEKIGKSTERLLKFVEDLVIYSRNARTEIKSEPIYFDKLIQNVLADVEFIPGEKEIKKMVLIDYTEPYYSDKYRLGVILNNLITNAIRYADVEIDEPFVRVHIYKENGSVVILVSDNGIGIDPEHKDQIFKMFYRATEQQAGSGLGLYIVKETVEKLHGNITYSSEAGKGTAFTVTLPLVASE